MKNYLSNLASTLQGIAGVISDGDYIRREDVIRLLGGDV